MTDGATTILLLRHGETAAPDRFHGGESDVGLGERGRAQAMEAARLLAARGARAVYASGMRRAMETARPIAEACGVPLRIEPRLHERLMGPLSGVSKEDGWETYQETKRRWTDGELHHTHEGGESFEAIRARALPAILEIAERHRGETVVVVAHGVTIRVLLCSLGAGLSAADFDRIGIEYMAVNELRRGTDGSWRVSLPPRSGEW